MKTIGYRKDGIGFLYIVTFFIGILSFIVGILYCVHHNNFNGRTIIDLLFCIIGGSVMTIVSLFELKCFFSTKPNAICADNEQMSVNGDKFSITDIVDVSYKRAKSRYCRYNYGEVIIYTRYNTYHVKNIADCEYVSKRITKLMYEKKNSKA